MPDFTVKKMKMCKYKEQKTDFILKGLKRQKTQNKWTILIFIKKKRVYGIFQILDFKGKFLYVLI